LSLTVNFLILISAQNGLQADSPENSININDITMFIDDSPVFPGENNLDLKVITVGDLILSAISIWKENGRNLYIYNDNTTLFNPIDSDEYMVLVSDGKKQGFAIIESSGELKSESEVTFSFSCTMESDELFGTICYDFEVKINGIKQNSNNIIKKHPIFLRGIKNSTSGSWSMAN
jgi:hypothetical protein